MMKKSLVAAALVLIPGIVGALPTAGPEPVAAPEAALGDWQGKAEDNVCGLSEVRYVTKPAVIDYDALMDATQEMRQIKRDGIDKNSAEGQVLITKATKRIKEAASAVMSDKGYCSVWKKISHKQGQKAADISDAVKRKLEA